MFQNLQSVATTYFSDNIRTLSEFRRTKKRRSSPQIISNFLMIIFGEKAETRENAYESVSFLYSSFTVAVLSERRFKLK